MSKKSYRYFKTKHAKMNYAREILAIHEQLFESVIESIENKCEERYYNNSDNWKLLEDR